MPPVARYTLFVSVFKPFLWGLVAAMIGLVLWVASDTGDNKARMVFSSIPKSEILQNIMSKPHYQGVDARNRPYTILAEKATQLDKTHVALEGVRADMVLGSGSWVALNAGNGLLDLESKRLELQGGVNIFYDGGYEFRSEHAYVDIDQGTAYGNAPIEGQGPLGTLKASQFVISERGQVIRFNGSVRIRFYH